MIDWLDDHSGFCTVLLTAVLAVVTWWYAKSAKRTVAEMQRQREDAALPVVSVVWRSFNAQTGETKLAVVNEGPGVALGVQIEISPDVDKQPKQAKEYYLASLGSSGSAWTQLTPVHEVLYEVSIYCEDVYGNGYGTAQTLDGHGSLEYSGPKRLGKGKRPEFTPARTRGDSFVDDYAKLVSN